MLKTATSRIANTALRALAMGSKFVLIFLLAKVLEPADVGTYGLFVATVAFSVLLIGGDFYTYAQRELLSVERERWSFVLQHQAIATGLLYLLLLPAQLVLFWLGLLPTSLLAWFFLLLVLEHLAQEVNRLLIAMGRPLIASWVLFIRMGAWVWPLLAVMWFIPKTRTLDAIFISWLFGTALAIALGATVVIRAASPWRRWTLDLTWLKRGFGVGTLFLVATICFKALTTVDRYVVEYLAGPEILGAYVLYVGMAMAIISLLEPAIYSFLFPRIVTAYRTGDVPQYRQLLRELAWTSIMLSLALAAVIALAAPSLLEWIGRPIYVEHLHLLWPLLGVAFFYAVGMVPHYGLYARGADEQILASHVSALFVFGIVTASLAPHAPAQAAAYGLLVSFAWLGGTKLVCYGRMSSITA